jgi:hypothetical protein
MNQRKDLLRELVREGLYVVPDGDLAEAIVTRARARQVVPGLRLRSPGFIRPRVRSFRRDPHARSFRLSPRQL